MKYVAILFGLSFLSSGCLLELLTTTAIQGELQAKNASAATRVLGQVKEDQALLTAQRGVDAYRAETGYNPGTLEELVPNFIAAVPMMPNGTPYGYNPNTGEVLDHAYDARLPSPQDKQLMGKIEQAINAYGTATGYYPPTLDQLVPNYLAERPRTTGGEEFVYNNQDGYLAHPRAGQQQAGSSPQPRQGGGGTGLSPMGDALTGMSVQQELNRGGGSGGASSAGTRSRQSVGGISSGHTQQQNQVMNNLGL